MNTNNVHLTFLFQILCKFNYLSGCGLKTPRGQNLKILYNFNKTLHFSSFWYKAKI